MALFIDGKTHMYTNDPRRYLRTLDSKCVEYTKKTVYFYDSGDVCPVCGEHLPVPQYAIEEGSMVPKRLFYDDICLVCANMASEETCSRIKQSPIMLVEVDHK
jgi:hypothetical protein